MTYTVQGTIFPAGEETEFEMLLSYEELISRYGVEALRDVANAARGRNERVYSYADEKAHLVCGPHLFSRDRCECARNYL